MIKGISSADLGTPDYFLSLIQHREYIGALESLGLQISVLPPDSRFPDSTFVEDVALCTSKMAVITNPGASSRNGEKAEMERVLPSFFKYIERLDKPGTLDAGDVMMAGNHFFIGISDRTNNEGAEQLIQILNKYNMSGEKIDIEGILHLKSGVSFLEKETILVQEKLYKHKAFSKFRKIMVPGGEEYAANSLWVNGTVLVPENFPKTKLLIEEAGYPTITLHVSEFEKLDGGLSCLSLRF
ncbi:dimethylarginine dimethylaminohydrolase family protein [Bacteroidota bacterium]